MVCEEVDVSENDELFDEVVSLLGEDTVLEENDVSVVVELVSVSVVETEVDIEEPESSTEPGGLVGVEERVSFGGPGSCMRRPWRKSEPAN